MLLVSLVCLDFFFLIDIWKLLFFLSLSFFCFLFVSIDYLLPWLDILNQIVMPVLIDYKGQGIYNFL